MRNLAVAERLAERQALDRSYCCFYHKRTHARTGRYFVCSCCCRRSIARAICSCSSAIFVKPCSRKRFALARCHFADFSSPGFSGLSSIDIGCPLEQVAQLSSAIRDMVWHSAWDIERRVASQPAQLRTSWIAAQPARHFGSLTYTGQGYAPDGQSRVSRCQFPSD